MPETGARTDPYTAFRFVLKQEQVGLAGFSEASGLDAEIEIEDYAEGGENRFVHKLPGRRKQVDLVLKRGLIGTELFDWFMAQQPGEVEPRNLDLEIQAFAVDAPSLAFVINDAFPVKWQGPQLDAGQSAVATETLTLAHQGVRRKGAS